jgi:hypothetical protein
MGKAKETPMPQPAIDPPTLSVDTDMICRIIARARAFDGKVAQSDPDADAMNEDDMYEASLEDRPSDPVAQELAAAIRDQSIDGQIDLVALMWLGRDSATRAEWREYRAMAAAEHTGHTARYLMGTPLLADHLSAGLDTIGLDCTDFDRDHA